MKILCIPRPLAAGSKAICTHRSNAAAEIALKNEARKEAIPEGFLI